jgi:CheY-like chemotaxis protein
MADEVPVAGDLGPTERLARPAVLLIDDDEAVRGVLRAAFEVSGWGVLEAENGYQGVVAAATHLPDLLVLDLMMPVMGGFATLQRLDELGILADMTVVVLSGAEDGPILRRANQALGVRGVWTKPIDPLRFVHETSKLLGLDVLAPRPTPRS